MLKNLLSYGVGEAFAKGLNLLLLLILPLVLSLEAYGVVVIVIAIEQVVAALALKGQNTAILRFHEVNKSDHQTFYSSIFYPALKNSALLVLLISSITLITLIVLSKEWFAYACIMLIVPLSTAFELKLAFLRASNLVKEYVANRVSFQVLKFTFVFTIAILTESVYAYIGGVFLALSTMFLIKGQFYVLLNKNKQNLDTTRKMAVFGFPLGLQAVINLSYVFADRVMLNSLVGEAQVSIYSFAYTVATSLMFFVNVIVISLLTGVYNEKSFRIAFIKLNKLTSLAVITVSIGALLIYFGVFPFAIDYYDNAYSGANEVLGIILICNVFHVLYLHGFYKLTILKTVKIVPLITAVVLVLNVLCNFMLIPLFGMNGAAYATLICEVILATAILLVSYIKSVPDDPR